jgi:hypothetical protein
VLAGLTRAVWSTTGAGQGVLIVREPYDMRSPAVGELHTRLSSSMAITGELNSSAVDTVCRRLVVH